MSSLTKEEFAFIGYLKWLLEQEDRSAARAAMAHLRRGLGKQPGTVYEMDRYMLSRLPDNVTSHQEDAYYLVGSLFAYWHQGKEKAETLDGERSTDRNLGKSLSRLAFEYAKAGGSVDDAKKRLEKRFNAFLEATSEDLPEYLRQNISQLKSKAVPVNWAQLLHDIQNWDADGRFVQHEWAKGFWVDKKSTDDLSEESTIEPEEE
jgi:CRISPR system Cascade subunit CasB